MIYSIHIGPYLIADRKFNWLDFESIVCDGRGEFGVNEKKLILIPNLKLDGIDRMMDFDRYDGDSIQHINPATIVRETAAFVRASSKVIEYCDSEGIEIMEGWGIVPCWS